MKIRIIVAKTIEYPDDEAELTNMGFENTGGDPREVARLQKEWFEDGTADVLEALASAGDDSQDFFRVQWWDEFYRCWRRVDTGVGTTDT